MNIIIYHKYEPVNG